MENRRAFIKKTALANAGLLTVPELFTFKGSPNEKVVIGVMGTNSRGQFLANADMAMTKEKLNERNHLSKNNYFHHLILAN